MNCDNFSFSKVLANIIQWNETHFIKVRIADKVTYPNTWIYVISEPESVETKGCKVGFHEGTWDALRKRYITPLPHHIIHLFLPANEATELRLKKEFESYRLVNNGENLSEWVQLPLHQVCAKVQMACAGLNVVPIHTEQYLEIRTKEDLRNYIEKAIHPFVERPSFFSSPSQSPEKLSGSFISNCSTINFSTKEEFSAALKRVCSSAAPEIEQILWAGREALLEIPLSEKAKKLIYFRNGEDSIAYDLHQNQTWPAAFKVNSPSFDHMQRPNAEKMNLVRETLSKIFPDLSLFRDLIRWHMTHCYLSYIQEDIPLPDYVKKSTLKWTIQSKGFLRHLFNNLCIIFNQGPHSGVVVSFSKSYGDGIGMAKSGVVGCLRLHFQAGKTNTAVKAGNTRINTNPDDENKLTMDHQNEFIHFFVNKNF